MCRFCRQSSCFSRCLINLQHHQRQYHHFCAGQRYQSASQCLDPSCFQCGRTCHVASQQLFERRCASRSRRSSCDRNMVRFVALLGRSSLTIQQVQRRCQQCHQLQQRSRRWRGYQPVVRAIFGLCSLNFFICFAGLTDLEPRTMPTMRETRRSSRNGQLIPSTAWVSSVSAGPQKRTSTSTPWHISTASLSSPCLWWRACQMCPTFSTWCPRTPMDCEFFTMVVDGKQFAP